MRGAQAAEKICAAGAEWADLPKAVAEATEVVFTSLPGPKEFEAVVRGDKGLIAGMSRGQPLFDLTTNSPTVIRNLEPLFAERGAVLLDSPVSGGPAGAALGQDGDLGRRRRAGLPALPPGARRGGRPGLRISARSARPRSPSWCTISAAT